MALAQSYSERELKNIDPDNRTLREVFNGEVCWVKYAAVYRRPFSSAVFNVMSKLSDAPVFRSTHNPDAIEALSVEAKRLRELAQTGFYVPRVIEQTRDHLVLSDVGTCVGNVLRDAKTPAERRQVMERVVDHLAEVHCAGTYHGRSVAKDLTISPDGQIGMIDLEHEPLKVMPLADAQSRDIWLLFMSAAKYQKQDPTLVTDMADRYEEKAPAAAVAALSRNVSRLETYTALVRPAIAAVAQGSQFHAIFAMNRGLNHHMNG